MSRVIFRSLTLLLCDREGARARITSCLLVVAMTLFTATSIEAAMTVDTAYTIGSGTTGWVSATYAQGSSSLELYWPKPGDNYSGVRITGLGDVTVEDLTGWSYWANAPEDYCPTFTISLDTPLANYAGRDYDTNVIIWPRNDGYADQWMEVLSSSDLPYTIWWNGGGPVMKTLTWAEFQNPFSQWGKNYDFGEAVVKQIRISNNGIGTNETITAYLDDFVIGSETYDMEPPVVPEPSTLIVWSGLGALGLALAWRRRKRA